VRIDGYRFDAARLHAHAECFSRERHRTAMQQLIADTLAAPEGTQW